ncbi:Bifunctional protein Aas [Aquisphaera giovannonii]|uniref:Bifunctional protein Aas n=1 Tax=Aquisphaera giovannonii TaxID=406548 RepID=A0A5B9WAV4_9BACT|nr:AMP-binding protein [Aquisphaera giovannonii]QEH37010.1 Bifunctional protein Aas [Aquisphaera giovannonii]
MDAAPSPGYRPLRPLPAGWGSLGHAFVSSVKAHWNSTALCDGTGTRLTFGETLVRSCVLGRYLSRSLGPERYVGVMLPPMVPAAVVNIALVLQGRIPVNLNFTAGQSMIDSSIRQCGIRHVITSPKVLDKFQVRPAAEIHPLEQVPARISRGDKLAGAAAAHLVRRGLLPGLLPGLRGRDLGAPATVIFTSGSTGDPKGVLLTHRNVLSNVLQVEEQVKLAPDEVLLGMLPFFHSFGFTVTIWTALCLGKKVVYHSNPLDSKTIGSLCEQHKVTLLAGTPSFTRLFQKSCRAEQFRTLTHLILGAEKLKPELYRDLEGWLGIEPMEGYGTTELSPVVAVNVPEEVTLADGRKVHGNRPGTVGLPVPGTRIKTIDPDTGEDLPQGAEGVIAVKGPQVMDGYLGRPEETARVIRDGWYVTGDIGFVDPDGFLKITDRQSRFAKIAGEMVPHLLVEGAIIEAAGVDETYVAVTSVPDPKHGERLCVIHKDLGKTPDEIHKALTGSHMPRLWIPSVRDFIPVDELPLTGTGKVDIRRIKELAMEACQV